MDANLCSGNVPAKEIELNRFTDGFSSITKEKVFYKCICSTPIWCSCGFWRDALLSFFIYLQERACEKH